MLHVKPDADSQDKIIRWLRKMRKHEIVLNVAGNRESRSPGIERYTVQLLQAVIQELGDESFKGGQG